MSETPPRFVWLVREDIEAQGIAAPVTNGETVAFATEEAAWEYADDLWYTTHVRTGRSIITLTTKLRVWEQTPLRAEAAALEWPDNA